MMKLMAMVVATLSAAVGLADVRLDISRDDGESWSPMRIVAETKERNLCEPFCLRSPDGKTLALLMRENRHSDCSMMCFSSDEGQTGQSPSSPRRS